jgi:hypothetical protein
MPASTSPLGNSLSVAGMQLQVDTGASPGGFDTIANVGSFKLPLTCKTVNVTNVGMLWEAMAPTIHSMGKITFDLFYIPEEVTHRNSPTAGTVAAGLMWLFLNANAANKAGLRNWALVFPDGANSGAGSIITWAAFVTSFSLDAKTEDVFKASMELTSDGSTPSLV